MKGNYKEHLKDINTFVFDVDGVLTNGSILVTSKGELLRQMNVKDGFAIKTAVDKGYHFCIISGGNNLGVSIRLKGLGVKHVFMGIHKKMEIFNRYLEEVGAKKENVLYMGDDIPDLPVLKVVGLATCPQNAVPEVKDVSDYVSHRNGGDGCVRDVIEQVLKVHGHWNVNP